ncbi:hypothetical protein ACWM9A_03420 [Acetobacter pasteurianus]
MEDSLSAILHMSSLKFISQRIAGAKSGWFALCRRLHWLRMQLQQCCAAFSLIIRESSIYITKTNKLLQEEAQSS